MEIYRAIVERRSIRRFKQKPVAKQILEKFVNAARLAPSAANLQPLRYLVVNNPLLVEKVFPTLKWAGYIAPAGDPPPGERPVAYIIVLVSKKIVKKGAERDVGAAVENILLAALQQGIGSCWIGSIAREKLKQLLDIPDYFDLDSVVALGYPNQRSVVEEMKDSVKYWKDKNGQFHVPKRRLKETIYFNRI